MFDIVPCTAKRVKVDPAFVEEVRKNSMFRAFTHSCLAFLCSVPLFYSLSFYLVLSRPPFGIVMMCWWVLAALLVLANALLAGSFFSAARRRIIVEVASAGGIVYVLTNGNKWKDYGLVHGYGVTDGGKQLMLEFERRPWSYPHIIAFVPSGMDAEACKSLLGIALPTPRAFNPQDTPELSPTASEETESVDTIKKLGTFGTSTCAYSTVSIKTMMNEQNLDQV